jgi:hypothetical protein
VAEAHGGISEGRIILIDVADKETPYYGDRKINPPLDEYEYNKNIFGTNIFRTYVQDKAL